MSAPGPDEHVPLGLIGKARGLRGDLWFRPYNEAVEALDEGARVRVTLRDGSARELVLAALEQHGPGLVVAFEGIDDRDAAEALVGATVSRRRADFPPLEPGEFYHCDLPGVRVVDLDGRDVGTVVRVEPYPTVDALVVSTPSGEVELPVTDDVVRSLDLEARVAVVDPAGWVED